MTTPHTSDSETVSVSEGSSGDSVAAPTISEELKPCPFCGSNPLEDRVEPHEHSDTLLGLMPLPFSYPGSWSVECVKCECRIFSHDSREEAVRRWNLRSASAAPVEGVGQAKPVEAPTGERRVNGFSVPSWNIKALGGAEMVLASDFDALAALRTDTAPGLPAPAAKPPTCGVAITEDERKAMIAGAVHLEHNADDHDNEPRADCFRSIAWRAQATQLRSLAARLSKGERG